MSPPAPSTESLRPASPGRSGFLRAVIVLVSGTAMAHGISALCMPVLARLYSPADFGLLAVFSSFLGIIAVAACLRYELAIALPEADGDAFQLLILSLLVCTALSGLLAAIVAFAPDGLVRLLGQPQLRPYLWMAPLGLFLAGAYSALQFWHVRRRNFGLLARTRVAQSAGSSAMQLGLGWAGISPLGLLTGYVMNTGVACLGLGGGLLRGPHRLSWQRIRELAFTYRRFPAFSSAEALANSAAIQLPMILIAAWATRAEAGHLTLAAFVAQAPLSLIGTAIGQVYLSRAPAESRDGRLGAFTAGILGKLFKAGAGPILALGLLAPSVFGIVFGAEWERSGWLLAWMTPWFLMQFLAVPIGLGLHVTGHLKAALMLQLGGLALRVFMVWAAAHWMPSAVSEAYAVSGALFYLTYLVTILAAVRAPWRQVGLTFRAGLPPTLLWALGAAALSLLIQLLRASP